MPDLTPAQLNLLQNFGFANNSNRLAYPNARPENTTNIQSPFYPQFPAVQLGPNVTPGRINYGNNKVASRTAGQLRGVGRGVQEILPGLLNSIYQSQILQAPALTAHNLALLQNYGPQFAQTASEISGIGRAGEAGTDLSLLQGPGRGITAETLAQMMATDPEYFNLVAGIGQRGGQLLEGLDPNKLTESEIANVERTQNRSNIGLGTANTGSNTAAIQGALGFDDRLQRKRNQLSGILSNLGGILPQTRSGAFNYANATGQAGRGAGQQEFASASQTPQSYAPALAGNILGQGGNLAANNASISHSEIPQWQQTLGAVYGGLGAIGSLAGGGRQ